MSSTDHLSELESLRSQVADLARELAERDRSMQDIREQSQLLRTIVEGTAAEIGDEFFASLVTHLTSTLHVQYAVIGEVLEGRLKKIRTLAVSAGGALVDNFEYELAYTPCATALTQTFTCFDRDVQATFPRFQRLADLGAESYCAVPLRTKGGTVIGLLVVMDTKPLQHSDYLQSLLGVFAPRIAAEFERKRAEQERAKALADLRNVMETVPDIMFTLDIQGNMVKWNRRVEEVTGYSPEELLSKPALAFVPAEERDRTAAAIQQAFTEGYAELEGHLLTKEHRLIPYHWTGALLKNPHGEPIGITGIGRDVSDKKRTEEELRCQRRHLVEAQALAHLGSWEWELDSGEVQWSDEQYRIFGHEPGAIAVTYDTYLTSLHPDDNDRALEAINDALLGKRPTDVECRIVRPDGKVRFIHVRGDVHRDATGQPLSMAGTVLDITERKQTEQALRASEERWQLAVQGSNDGIWDWNIQTGDVFFSSHWKSMRGFEDHDITNHVDEWRSRIHPHDLDRVLQNLESYLAKQTSEFCEEYRVQKKDGSYLWILDRGMALWADDGTPLRMAGSETDITERKRAEELLRRSEERFRTMFAQAPIGIALIDSLTGEIREVNDRYAQIAGRTMEELLGLDWMMISHPDDVQTDLDNMARINAGAIAGYQMEKRLVRPDGTIVWIDLTVAPIQVEAHAGPHHLAMMTDITGRRKVEDALALREQELRTVLDTLPIGVWFTDAQGKMVLCNPAAREIWTGVKQVSVPNAEQDMQWWEQTGLLAEPHRWALTRTLVKGEAFVNDVLEIDCLDGSRKIIRNSAVPVRRADGALLGGILVNEDITTLRQAQQALRLTQFSVDHAVEGFFWIGSDARILNVNDSACRMLEYTREELTTMSIHDIDPNFSPEAWPAHWEELKQKGSLTFESKHWSKTGRVLDTEVTINYLLHEGKEYNCAIMRDIGEHRRAQEALAHLNATLEQQVNHRTEALRSSEERLKQAVEVADLGIFEHDHLADRIKFSPRLQEMFGWDLKDPISQDEIFVHVFPLDQEALVTAIRLAQDPAGNGRLAHEHRVVWSDGSIHWLSVLAQTWFVGEGSDRRPLRTLGAVQDITDRRMVEETLARLNIVLKQEVADQTRELQESEQAIRSLHEAAAAPGLSFDDRMQAVLEVGCRRFKLPIGMLTQVVGEQLEFVQVWAPGTDFTAGMAVPLGNTYCNTTLQATNPVCFEHAGISDWRNHPGYKALGLESYIGTKLIGRDQVYGTICFTGQDPLLASFSQADKDFVQLMARWISGELDRQKAEQALKQSEERYRTLYDETPTMYFTLATDGTILSVNRFGAEQLGYLVEELVGHSVPGVIYEEDKETVVASLSECLVTPETTRHWEFRKIRKDGSILWVRETARVGQSPTGETIVLVTSEDITERKQAERESRLRTQQAMEMQAALLALANLNDVDLALSELISRVTEIAANTLEVARASVWLLSEDQTELVCQDLYEGPQACHSASSRLKVLKYPRYFEAIKYSLVVAVSDALVDPRTNEFADDYLLPLEIISIMDVPIRRQGELIGVVCFEHVGSPREWSHEAQSFGASVGESVTRMIETTERRQVEEALRESEERLRSFMRNSPSPVFYKSLEGRYLYVNQAFARIFQLSAEQVIGKTDYAIFPHEQADQFVANDRQVFHEEQAIEFEETARYCDGMHTNLIVKFPLRGADGAINGIVGGIATDITARKRMEEALHQRESDLRAALEERERISQDLHDGILQSLFAVGLTLETTKSMMAPRTRKTSGPPLDQAITQLNLVMREIRNFIAGLSSDLLQGKDLSTALQQMLASLTENQTTRVRLAVEDRAAQAVSAKQALHLFLVIQEAVSNCIRHGGAQEARVSLKMLKQGVRLSIRDNGRGFNLDAAKGIGHGLGNMAARAQKIGGRFTVLSKVNKGTSIVLDLPKEADDVRS